MIKLFPSRKALVNLSLPVKDLAGKAFNYSGPALLEGLVPGPEGYFLLSIRQPEIAAKAKPGQFVMLGFPESREPLLLRPFDILDTDPERSLFRLIVKVVGKATRLLASSALNTSLHVIGPLGCGIEDYQCRSLAVLARGCGVAAVYFFLKEAFKRGCQIHIVLSAATSTKLILRDELVSLATSLYLATDDGSEGEKALGSLVLKRLVAEQRVERVYSCGGGPFYLADLKEIEQKYHLPVYLFLESYMACGFGQCHGCAVKMKNGSYAYVCQDGPLFRLEDLEDLCPIYQ